MQTHKTRTITFTLVVLCGLLLTACGDDAPPSRTDAPVLSLDGRTLEPVQFRPDRLDKLMADYEQARLDYEEFPDSVESHIWFGRRAAYLWRYREAIDVYTRAIDRFPDDPRLYRHRGHRFITVRDFQGAEADFLRAVELIEGTEDQIEPDGAPNAAGIPVSTLHTNIWYHLGLAHYLQGDFEEAASAFQMCLDASGNDDMRVAASDWLYMSLMRSGAGESATTVLEPINENMELLENESYHKRLLMYKGLMPPDSLLSVNAGTDVALTLATQGYGVGNFYLYNGDTTAAVAIFNDVVAGDYWPAFGYLAAEADLQLLSQ